MGQGYLEVISVSLTYCWSQPIILDRQNLLGRASLPIFPFNDQQSEAGQASEPGFDSHYLGSH